MAAVAGYHQRKEVGGGLPEHRTRSRCGSEEEESRAEVEEQEPQGHGGTSGKRKPPYPSEQASLAGDVPVTVRR